ncbi:response regulator [Cecembia calidifontis]|jgi:DNA-binding NarL/FixJ family response regulator|uniref:LuxR family two component transcriptional regulator n=1 Tax=Cecembia calidifontis TaxID=1187080 RepID=A0A4Q7PE18_9BACT|nr:response regulator transcription factor [Cecembia calidifontis]RZS98631.1 LuxR family two component transcriptional regulator [Cecembia calidifontis]
MKTRLFIVDDHYLVIEGIRSMLQQEESIEWMGHATNGESCLAFLQIQEPEVILMDISMPGMSGIELCKEVKSRYPGIRILGLSTFNQRSFVEKMIESGASGYVLKNANKEELLKAIQAAKAFKSYLSFDASQVLKSNLEKEAPVLTRREKEVLDQIAEGMTNQEIAEKLFISATTVDTHRKNLMLKFEAKNVASLIHLAAKAGYL